MKSLSIPLLFALACSIPAFIYAEDLAPVPGHEVPKPEGPKLIQSFTDVLAVIPDEFSPGQAKKWTEVKKNLVNVMLKENLVDLHTPARFRAKVSEVAWWPGLTLCWEVPNQEGYHIRLFAGFTDDWKARLSMLDVGDEVIVEGTMSHAAFEKVWGDHTLCLCMTGCSFSRTTDDKPAAAESTASREVRIISAVYGTEAKFADVTQRVQYFIRQKGRTFQATPDWLDADPAYGLVKSLVIVYELKGQRHLYTTAEGGGVDADTLVNAGRK